MDDLLRELRACADPTRLRLLAVCARGAFCVAELTDIIGQSQPRLSRHLKLLTEAGLLERSREGAQAWFSLATNAAPAGAASALLARLDAGDRMVVADRRAAARVLAERTRVASERFTREGADWDEMRALDLPAARVEAALLGVLAAAGPGDLGRVLDLGTGTGRLLALLAPHALHCTGIDASPAMLALARSRLAEPALAHCRVQKGDVYRLPFEAARFDLVVAQMLLHHAEDPGAVLCEACRVLRPGGRMVVIDIEAGHSGDDLQRGTFRWPGFTNPAMRQLLSQAGLTPRAGAAIAGPLTVRLWPAARPFTPPEHA